MQQAKPGKDNATRKSARLEQKQKIILQTPLGQKTRPKEGSPGDPIPKKIQLRTKPEEKERLTLEHQLVEIEQLRRNKTELETYQSSIRILFRQLCLAFYIHIQVAAPHTVIIPGTTDYAVQLIIDRLCEIIPHMPIKRIPRGSSGNATVLFLVSVLNMILRELAFLPPENEHLPGKPPAPTPIYFAPEAAAYNPRVITAKEDFAIYQIDQIYGRKLPTYEEEDKQAEVIVHKFPAIIEHLLVLNLKLISQHIYLLWQGKAICRLLEKNDYFKTKAAQADNKLACIGIFFIFSQLMKITEQPGFDPETIISALSCKIDDFYLYPKKELFPVTPPDVTTTPGC